MRFAAWMVLLATLALWSGNWIVARAVREEITHRIMSEIAALLRTASEPAAATGRAGAS